MQNMFVGCSVWNESDKDFYNPAAAHSSAQWKLCWGKK